MSDKKLTTLRPDGWLFSTDLEGRVHEQQTVKCKHCGGHFTMVKGSGRLRGWCARCNGYICGPQCAECIPEERLLESIEKGVTPEQLPVVISTAGLVVPGNS